MNTKKMMLIGTGLFTIATLWVFAYSKKQIVINSVDANPDYICVKSVSHGVCDNIERCDPWDLISHTRTCYWYNVTKTAYYHTRTSCESWYVVAKRWSTASSNTAARFIKDIDYNALDSEWKKAFTAHPTSWRHSRDVVWATESCSIRQVDTSAPIQAETTEYR